MSTKYYGSLLMQTPVFNTGNGDFTRVDDTTQANFPVGGIYIFPDSLNRPRIIKYVKWNPTVQATYYQGQQVYYKDETRTVVTNEGTEAATYLVSTIAAIFSFAGLVLKPAAPSALGDFVFIQTGGFCDKIRMPASTTAGDMLVLSNAIGTSPTNSTLVRVAGGTDLGQIKSLMAYVIVTTAAASGGGLGSGWINTPLMPV
jgi:hypothetical protein